VCDSTVLGFVAALANSVLPEKWKHAEPCTDAEGILEGLVVQAEGLGGVRDGAATHTQRLRGDTGGPGHGRSAGGVTVLHCRRCAGRSGQLSYSKGVTHLHKNNPSQRNPNSSHLSEGGNRSVQCRQRRLHVDAWRNAGRELAILVRGMRLAAGRAFVISYLSLPPDMSRNMSSGNLR
jgi:hypothetical protein